MAIMAGLEGWRSRIARVAHSSVDGYLARSHRSSRRMTKFTTTPFALADFPSRLEAKRKPKTAPRATEHAAGEVDSPMATHSTRSRR